MCRVIKGLSKGFFVVFLLSILFVNNGFCQDKYPERPITIFNPWMGGHAEGMTRAVCKIVEKEWGQPFVMVGKPGGSGIIGMDAVVKSKPDGYTIGITSIAVHLINPHVEKPPFNALTDFVDIVGLYRTLYALSVRADAPWNSYEELIKYARENPGKFKYATTGVSSSQSICMQRIAAKEGIRWTAVPFKSEGECILSVLGGNTNAATQSSISTSDYVKAGKLKLLMILADKHWPTSPNTPHMLEKGYDFFAFSYNSIIAPAGLPEPIRAKLEDSFKRALRDPSVIEMASKFQVELVGMGGKEYSAFWRSKYDEYGEIVKKLEVGGK